MKNAENLTTKNIKEFTTEDTVYLVYTKDPQFPVCFLCQFIKFENGKVYGKAISTESNPTLWESRIKEGLFIDCKLANTRLYGQKKSDKSWPSFHAFDSLGFAYYPEPDQDDLLHQKDHPSYGIMNFNRVQSSEGESLFGSTLKHNHYITLTIHQGELNRGDLNYDSYSTKDRIIEVNMSESQFAELITTFNRGSGVPVTITNLNGKSIEECPFVSKTAQFNAEFKQKMKNLTNDLQKTIEKANAILESSKPINKGERELILKSIQGLVSAISGSLPFINDQFTEQMDKTVSEAKATLEAFFLKRSKELGAGEIEKKPIEIGE